MPRWCPCWCTGCSGRWGGTGSGWCWTTPANRPALSPWSPPATNVTAHTVSKYVHQVRVASAGLTLPAELIEEVTRRSLPGEDHTARKRIAATLHLAVPVPPRHTVTRALVVDSDARAAAVTAGRVLATAGPLPLDVLIAAVARCRRFRRDPPDPDALTAALTALLAAPAQDGTWHATAAARTPARTGPSPRPRQAGTSPART